MGKLGLLKEILNPSTKDALKFIEKHHKSKADKTFLQIIGDCMIDYKGRARSFLDWGERIVMIKQDGAVLAHQPTMRVPINWQPAGSISDFSINKDKLIIKSRSSKPAEKMKIAFRSIKMVFVDQFKDNAKLVITGLETDFVNEIVKDPEIIEEGLRVSKREKHVKSGMIDLFCYDKEHTPVVIEAKRSLGSISAVQQLRMYVSDIKRDIDIANVRGILCAPKIPDMVKKLLADYGLEWHEVERRIILPDDCQSSLKEFQKE
jgi:RecB family endonuclease NucS